MTIAARFLRQEATWQRLLSSDSYNGDTYDDAETIAVRWFTETDRLDTAQGITRVATTYISTLTEVAVGDRITDENGTIRFVESVRKNRSVKGTVSHYVAALQ
jgi:hypothetical protein